MYAVDLMPLFISLFFLAVVVLWLAIQNYKNVTMTAIIIPLTLLATVISYMTVDRILGYPIKADMAEDSLYLSHIESSDTERIFVWIIEPGANKPRSISIMNTDNNRKAMADAKAKTEAGIKQKMRKKPSDWKRNSNESSEQRNQGMTEGEFDTLPGPNPSQGADSPTNPQPMNYEDLPQLSAP